MSAKLIYVMGASGVGKDSFLQAVSGAYAGILIAPRYITRPRTVDGENHLEISTDRFAFWQHNKLFTLSWQAHGVQYGIGTEILHWLEQGHMVMVNGSRSYMPVAQRLLGDVFSPLCIVADADILRQRLCDRGRETSAQIEQRIERASALQHTQQGVSVLHNNTTMADLLDQFGHYLDSLGVNQCALR